MITISVSDSTWKKLISLKKPGESFDSVISKLLKKRRTKENGNERSEPEN